MNRIYEDLALQAPHDGLRFLNYGYAPEQGDFSWVRPGDESFRYHLALVREVLNGVDLQGRRVLEVGCGRGGNCAYVSNYTRAQYVVGCDISPGNIAFCRRVYSRSGLNFVQGDAQWLPFRDESFDVVLNIESSHCYPDLRRFFEEAYRVVRPGGVLAYTDFWHLKAFRDDWNAREAQFATLPFIVERNEDITHQVLCALNADDGLSSLLAGVREPGNEYLIDWLVQTNVAMQASMAARLGTYRLCRFRKAGEEGQQ